jgi:hypothetical protein
MQRLKAVGSACRALSPPQAFDHNSTPLVVLLDMPIPPMATAMRVPMTNVAWRAPFIVVMAISDDTTPAARGPAIASRSAPYVPDPGQSPTARPSSSKISVQSRTHRSISLDRLHRTARRGRRRDLGWFPGRLLTTTPSPNPSSASTKPNSSPCEDPGGPSKTSSWPPSAGSTGRRGQSGERGREGGQPRGPIAPFPGHRGPGQPGGCWPLASPRSGGRRRR